MTSYAESRMKMYMHYEAIAIAIVLDCTYNRSEFPGSMTLLIQQSPFPWTQATELMGTILNDIPTSQISNGLFASPNSSLCNNYQYSCVHAFIVLTNSLGYILETRPTVLWQHLHSHRGPSCH